MKSSIITVDNVWRTFRSTKKSEGSWSALRLLVNPEFKSHDALKGVSFSIEPGSFTGLIGANGAGKTTLLKILSGLIAPTRGSAQVLGFDPFKRPMEFRRKIALVMGQKAQLWWDLPATDAFDLLRAIYDIPSKTYKDRLEQLSTLLDVKPHLNTQIRRLSLGERMKMELIGALIHWPKVVFLDEPTIGLDVLAAHKLREFLRDFNRLEKATVILTSHNMDDIQELCSRVLILRSGQLIYDGTPNGLTREGERRLRLRFMQSPTLDELAAVSLVAREHISVVQDEAVEESGETQAKHEFYFTIEVQQIATVLQRLMARYQVVNMGIEEQSLESVIHQLYADDRARESVAITAGANP